MGQYYNFPNLDVIFLVPSYNSAKGLNLSPQSFNVINYATLYNALNGLIYNPSSGKTYNYQTPLQSTTQQLLQIPSVKNQITAFGINQLTDLLSNGITNNIFGTDSEVGRNLGSIFSQGISSAGNTLADNIIKGQALSQGLGRNVGASVGGAAAGVAANYIGKGINALGGNSKLSRGIGAGVATGLGSLGGTMASNLAKGQSLFNGIKGMSSGDLAGLGMSVVGAGLQAAFGPSKEYGGTYGGITKGMDTAYDLVQMGLGFVPGANVFAGAMALNKGLSNVFGSTSGMTRQDAILGSAFMPAPVKWLNMAGAKTTDTFKNQSWQNQEKATDFMQDSFGDLNDKFNKARKEAGKTYGTFSRHAYNKAQGNLDFANRAWNQIMEMANLNVLQNIRGLDMTSINNQRYAQDIMGGFHPLYRGKQGMKIFNNTTNHNIGMRLLSAAALIDNKAMILSALSGTKVKRPKMKSYGSPERTRPSYMTEEEWNEYLEDKKRFEEYKKSIGKETDYGTPYTEEELQLLKEYNTLKQAEINLKILERNKAKEKAAARFNKQVNTVMGAMTLQANETPFTGQEYQQAAKNLRQEKVEEFHEKAGELEKGFNAALMADLAVSAAPLLLRGFRWAFNKAGLLVKVPNKNSLKGFNFNDLPQEKYVYNKNTGDFDVVAPKKEWVRIGENDLVPDYFQSRAEYDRLIASGASPEEAAEIMGTRYLNIMSARPGIFRNLGKRSYGESRVENGVILPVYNNRKHVLGSLNDAKTTLNTVFHELGGHGSSMNVQYGVPLEGVSDEMALSLFKILEHNEKLRPKLRPFFLAIKDGNLLKAKELIPEDGSYLKGMNGEIDVKRILDWIKYMEENLEYSARAIGSNMSNHYGMPNGFNEQQLREIFTDESVDNLLKNVWNYGVPITVGGSTAATLYNTNK